MTTFSQLIDDMVLETRRPDMRKEITDYLNQTLREVQFDPRNSAAVMLRENFNETVITATGESLQWQVPDPGTFQAIQVVQYLMDGHYPPERVPSRALATLRRFYYRVGGTYVFSGFGGQGSQVAIGWYEYPRRLVYYPEGKRPATYDADIGWTYIGPFAESEQLRTSAQAFTSNWLLIRWRDTLAEGVRSKIYKRVGDDTRAKTCYSLYTQMRSQLISSESADLGGFV